MRTRHRLATTVVTTALGPKIPPFVGDATSVPTATTAPGYRRSPLVTTAAVAAIIPKLPPFKGD